MSLSVPNLFQRVPPFPWVPKCKQLACKLESSPLLCPQDGFSLSDRQANVEREVASECIPEPAGNEMPCPLNEPI